jgi:hypothetical protein
MLDAAHPAPLSAKSSTQIEPDRTRDAVATIEHQR